MGKVIQGLSMERISLKASKREKGPVNKLRKSGMVPAVLYGHNVENQSLSVNQNEFEKVLRKAGESTIIDLLIDEGKPHPVLIHDVQRHFMYSTVDHIDFYQVSMTEKLKANIVLEFTGESEAVKAMGGTLFKNLSEVEVECLPADLPHNFVVDISPLKTFDDSITVADLQVSDKVEILTPKDEVIAKVQPPRDVEAELAEPVVEDISAVEGAAEDKPEAAEGKEGDTKGEKSAKGGSASRSGSEDPSGSRATGGKEKE